MTKDEIYDHLAQVYLGKKQQQKKQPGEKKKVSAWVVFNIVITVVIFASSFYGFTAFLTHHRSGLKDKIIYALNRSPIRVPYRVGHPYPQVKAFSLAVPDVDAGKYGYLEFSARGTEEGAPEFVRIEVRNRRNEVASVLIDGVDFEWQKKKIALDEFEGIADWSSVVEIQFILESWNVKKDHGVLLIDDVCFSS